MFTRTHIEFDKQRGSRDFNGAKWYTYPFRLTSVGEALASEDIRKTLALFEYGHSSVKAPYHCLFFKGEYVHSGGQQYLDYVIETMNAFFPDFGKEEVTTFITPTALTEGFYTATPIPPSKAEQERLEEEKKEREEQEAKLLVHSNLSFKMKRDGGAIIKPFLRGELQMRRHTNQDKEIFPGGVIWTFHLPDWFYEIENKTDLEKSIEAFVSSLYAIEQPNSFTGRGTMVRVIHRLEHPGYNIYTGICSSQMATPWKDILGWLANRVTDLVTTGTAPVLGHHTETWTTFWVEHLNSYMLGKTTIKPLAKPKAEFTEGEVRNVFKDLFPSPVKEEVKTEQVDKATEVELAWIDSCTIRVNVDYKLIPTFGDMSPHRITLVNEKLPFAPYVVAVNEALEKLRVKWHEREDKTWMRSLFDVSDAKVDVLIGNPNDHLDEVSKFIRNVMKTEATKKSQTRIEEVKVPVTETEEIVAKVEELPAPIEEKKEPEIDIENMELGAKKQFLYRHLLEANYSSPCEIVLVDRSIFGPYAEAVEDALKKIQVMYTREGWRLYDITATPPKLVGNDGHNKQIANIIRGAMRQEAAKAKQEKEEQVEVKKVNYATSLTTYGTENGIRFSVVDSAIFSKEERAAIHQVVNSAIRCSLKDDVWTYSDKLTGKEIVRTTSPPHSVVDNNLFFRNYVNDLIEKTLAGYDKLPNIPRQFKPEDFQLVKAPHVNEDAYVFVTEVNWSNESYGFMGFDVAGYVRSANWLPHASVVQIGKSYTYGLDSVTPSQAIAGLVRAINRDIWQHVLNKHKERKATV